MICTKLLLATLNDFEVSLDPSILKNQSEYCIV